MRSGSVVKELTALLAEDHSDLRLLLDLTLERGGFHVVQATDGQDALDQIARVAPDVLVTDLQMPRVDGLQLVRTVRALAGYQRLPILLLTGSPDDARAREIASLPLVKIVVKPPSWAELADRLVELVEEAQHYKDPPLPVELLDVIEVEAERSNEPGVEVVAQEAREQVERASDD